MPRWLILWNTATLFLLWAGLALVAVPMALAIAVHGGQPDISRDDLYFMRVTHPGGQLIDPKTFKYCDGRQWVYLDWEWSQTYRQQPCERKPTE